MDIFLSFALLLSVAAIPVCLFAIVIQAIRKKAKKKWVFATIASVVVFILALILMPTCEHVWIEADCERAKTCSLCDFQEGEALGHEFSELKTTREATCTEMGYMEGKCTRCGVAIKEEIPMKKHQLGNAQNIKEATCTESGEIERECLTCNYTEKETELALGHSEGEWEITEEATYFEEGIRNVLCSKCHEVIRTESYELSEEEKEAAFLKICEKVDYESIARYPEKYIDKPVTFKGEVVQVIENNNEYTMRVDITWNGYYYEDTVWVEYTRKDISDGRILEGDIVTVYGFGSGTETYSSVLLSKITIPSVVAEYVYF